MDIEHITRISIYQDLAAGAFGIAYFMLIYSLFIIKNRTFTSFDKKPSLLPNALLNVGGDVSKTVRVKTGLFIKSFPVFDVTKGFFIMDLLVWFEFNQSLISMDGIDNFTFENASKISKSKPDIHISQHGLLVKYNVQLFFSANLDNRFFPMNDHQLFVVLTNEHFSPDEVVFDVNNACLDCRKDLNTQDWYVFSKQVESGYVDISLQNESIQSIVHPRVLYTLSLKKTGLRKVALIIMPIMLLLFLASTSALPILETSTLGIAIGCVTGMLGYRYVINSISPNVGYFTLAEHVYNIALGLVFFSFALTLNKSFIKYAPYGIDLGIVWFVLIKIIMLSCLYFLLFRWTPHVKASSGERLKEEDQSSSDKSKQYLETTLSDILAYMSTVNQNVPADNDDPLNPDYSGFYHHYQIKPFKSTWLARFWMSSYCCSPIFISDLLMACHSMYRVQHDALGARDYILKLPIHDDSSVIVFGDISGDFHALGRHLHRLKTVGILDDKLQLLNPNDFIIFNGNVIDGSPYLLETVSIVMLMLLKNKDHVFYIRGESEAYRACIDQPIGHEIECKLSNINRARLKQAPLFMDEFLSSLPSAIYLHKQDKNKPALVRISSCQFEKKDGKNHVFKSFITQPSKAIEAYGLDAGMLPCEFALGISIDAIVQRSDSLPTARSGKILSLLPPAKGVIVWGVCSSFRLLNPAESGFVVLKASAFIENWSFDVYQQARDDLRNYSIASFNMKYGYSLNGQSVLPEKGATQDDFILSSTMDLSKTALIVSQRVYHGIYTKLIEQNGLGGIHGQHLKLPIIDDEYAPAKAKKNVLDLIERYPSKIMLSPVGTPTLEEYSDLIRDKKILVMFPISGGSILRKPEFDHILYFRSSFAKEGQELIKFAVNKKGARRFAVFYQDDSYGLGVLNGIKQTLADIQLDWIPVPYQRNNPNIERGVMEIRNFNADAILFFSTAAPSIALIHQLGIPQVSNINLIAISYASNSFQELLQSMNLKLIRTHLVPPLDSELPIVKEYRNSLKNDRFCMGPSDESLEGYINVSLLSYIMNSIEPPITKEKMIERINAIQPFNYKGLSLQFNPMTRELYNDIWIEFE